MKVAGFTFIRNAIKNDYSIVEAIQSILPICEEFVVAVGNSEDDTLGLIQSINSPKIKIIQTVWDDSKRAGGEAFALETDKALMQVSKDVDWAFYIQGDECVHEEDLPVIQSEMAKYLSDSKVEGLLFHYKHFYGSYDYLAHSRRWYRREIRIVRPHIGVHSYRDAQGFRLNNRKLNVKLIPAFIYHYGWVKPPSGIHNKVRNFNQFYKDEQWMKENMPESFEFDFSNADRLLRFEGKHPKVMQKRIEEQNWPLFVDTKKVSEKMNFRRKVLQFIEDKTGWRLGEYKNYEILK
ncbi:glycosyltransferase family 2 protein [Sandaracinomonas limnophila]|uniref:Glycosyltransferase family 2 protein n=1 Tax=Sandaracinomonas limnophila TaxID=1862386 RepID=A0A437PS18_9BACT|nr:glycosyltransferase family 2 protein [Sandaracinomonas limnophila]RVU25046.1 glycosyltransferase family 2 protein [Sandaracinomonas limnophila]